MATPLLGFFTKNERTRDMEIAHDDAESTMIHLHGLIAPVVQKGTKIILTDAWAHPKVVADVGRRLMREMQLTGSCVKVGGTNAMRVTIAVQRLASTNPTKAFEPFCWHNYAMSRHAIGDDSQGEGSLGSTFAASLEKDGERDWPQDVKDTLPDYIIEGDHIRITEQQEMVWSSYRNPALQSVLKESVIHPLGKAAPCSSTQDIKAMILNGYGVSFACNNYIGNGSVTGSGSSAYVRGRWDGNGGHQQWAFGYWEHPSDGPLFAVGNNWSDNTYPQDPAGLPLCCLWVKESDVAAAMRLDSEVYGYSSQSWFPAQSDFVMGLWEDTLPRAA